MVDFAGELKRKRKSCRRKFTPSLSAALACPSAALACISAALACLSAALAHLSAALACLFAALAGLSATESSPPQLFDSVLPN